MNGAWPVTDLSAALAPLLPGLRVEIVPEIDSTNTELMRRARAGDTAPVLLVAERQTAGRGRLGRDGLGGRLGHGGRGRRGHRTRQQELHQRRQDSGQDQ